MKCTLFTFLFVLFCLNSSAQSQLDTTIKEDNGFVWVITELFDGDDFKRGAKKLNGEQLIPCEYSWVYYHDHYFYAIKEKGESSLKALYTESGECIIPIDEKANDITVIQQNGVVPYVLLQKGKKYGVYSVSGEEIVEAKYDNIFSHENKYYTKNTNGDVVLVYDHTKKIIDEVETELANFLIESLANLYGVSTNSSNESKEQTAEKRNISTVNTTSEVKKKNSENNGGTNNSHSLTGGSSNYVAPSNFGGYNGWIPTGVSTYGGGNVAPAYSGGSSVSGSTVSGSRICHLCAGSGQCKTCMGRGYYYSSFGSGTLSCPNCDRNQNGRCSSCHGTGRQ